MLNSNMKLFEDRVPIGYINCSLYTHTHTHWISSVWRLPSVNRVRQPSKLQEICRVRFVVVANGQWPLYGDTVRSKTDLPIYNVGNTVFGTSGSASKQLESQ